MDFTPELALALYNSEEEFPVDFDDAWQWIGYEKRGHAESKMTNNFSVDVDYQDDGRSSPSSGGREANRYRLTVDCFKSLGMMAATENGRKIRKHFLDCEKRMKQLLAEKSIRDLNINTQINVSNDPGAAFRPEYVERVRQFRLEIEKVRDSLMLTVPEAAYAAIEVIYKQFCLDFGLEVKPLTCIGLTTLARAATGTVEVGDDSTQVESRGVVVAVAEKPKYNLTSKELYMAVAVATEGKDRVYLQDLAEEILYSKFSDQNGRNACSRLVSPLKRLGFKVHSQRTQVNVFGEAKCRSLYVRHNG